MSEKRMNDHRTRSSDKKMEERPRKHKRKQVLSALAAVVLLILLACIFTNCASRHDGGDSAGSGDSLFPEDLTEVPDTSAESYGVFLGVDEDSFSIDLFEGHDMVVVDAQELRKEQLAQLHARGHIVYSYLNVGSIEDFREYYEDFEDICLDRYKNWPEENWIDVTKEEWQRFVTMDLPARIMEKDPLVDGLFLDNLDVYFHMASSRKYRADSEKAYQALVGILQDYRSMEIPVLINGAEDFVLRLLDEDMEQLIEGVNQETVFTAIADYKRDRFEAQDEEETEHYAEYLEQCAKAGLQVFLLEYTDDLSVEAQIAGFCREHDYRYYISRHVNLVPSTD